MKDRKKSGMQIDSGKWIKELLLLGAAETGGCSISMNHRAVYIRHAAARQTPSRKIWPIGSPAMQGIPSRGAVSNLVFSISIFFQHRSNYSEVIEKVGGGTLVMQKIFNQSIWRIFFVFILLTLFCHFSKPMFFIRDEQHFSLCELPFELKKKRKKYFFFYK